MKNNKHKYTSLRFSRLILAPFSTFLSFFIKKNKNIIITASYNTEYSDNSKALFEMLIKKEEYKKRVFFVINNEAKRDELNEIYPGKFISNFGLKNKIFILKARFWFCSSMELPLASFLQGNLRQVIHLGHGMLYKKIGLIESKVSWYKKLYYEFVTSSFTYSIATSSFCKKYVAAGFGLPLERVLLMPQPKTAQIANPEKILDPLFQSKNNTHILYAPTWRPYDAIEFFPFANLDLKKFCLFLAKNNIHIWLRAHPRFETELDSSLLECQYIHFFDSVNYNDINSYLDYFQALITDYSSIYFDFLTLERPVLFLDYDFDCYNEHVGVIENYKEVKSSETITTIEELEKQLIAIKNNNYDLSKIKEINKVINYPIELNKIEEEILK